MSQALSRLRGAMAIVTGHVERRIAAATFLAVLAVGFAVMLPGYARLETRFVEDQQRHVVELVRSAVDPDAYPTLEKLTAIGTNLAEASDISGGTFVTGIGEQRAGFGEAPELGWAEARLGSEPWRISKDHSVFETFLGPEITGLAYGAILRLDTREAWSREVSRMIEMSLLGLLLAISLSVAVLLIVRTQVTRPARAIKRAVEHALDRPEAAGAVCSRLGRNDELGALSLAVDQLLFAAQHAYEEELPPARHMAEGSPHAMLDFSPDGHLMSANAAALRLFSAREEAELRGDSGGPTFRFEGKSATAAELLGAGNVFGHGEVVRAGVIVPCLVSGHVARREDGSPTRFFLVFVDMSEIMEDVRREVRERKMVEQRAHDLALQVEHMRAMFDACMVLLELGGANAARPQDVTIAAENLVDGWLDRAVTRGTMGAGCVEHRDLPPLLGDPGELRRLVDFAFEVVRLRSGASRPVLAAAATMEGSDAAILSIWAKADDGQATVDAIRAGEDVSPFLGAISALARRNGGSLSAPSAGGDGNLLAVRLRVDRRMMDLDLGASDETEAA